MTAYELRHHLRRYHNISLVGADYATLETVHNIERRSAADHAHSEAGHFGGGIEQLVWLVLLAIVIIVLLRVAGVHW